MSMNVHDFEFYGCTSILINSWLCYYQPIAWCIQHGFHRFEGGAQGEHKMARALLPIKATSAHWLAHPAFAEAVQRFLDREGQGIENYMEDLGRRSPLRGVN
jgi:uncharacterized protein